MDTVGMYNRERIIKSAAVGGIIVLCALIILKVDNILLSFILAFVISYLLAPVVNAAERTGISRKVAVAGLFLFLTALFATGIYLLLPVVTAQVSALRSELPHFIDGVSKLLITAETRINAILSGVYQLDVSATANRVLSGLSGQMFEDLPRYTSSSLAVLILAPFFAFFMVLDGQAAAKKILELVPNNLFEPALNLKHRMNAQLGGYIRARLLEAGIVCLVVWLGLAVIGFPYAVLLGTFAGLTNLIPYIGPIIGAVPAILMTLVTGASGLTVLAVVAVYTVAQLIDNFVIIPLVVARIVDLHPVVVVIVIIVGAQLAGIIGMIISIPVACILKLTAMAIYEHLVEFGN